MPAPIPSAGTPGGPPTASKRELMWGLPFDLRGWAVNVQRHPARLPAEMQDLMQRFQRPAKAGKQ
ncbi:MAG TPA: hypothetical protein VGG97_21390 [Bryobacteraceae bacterium]